MFEIGWTEMLVIAIVMIVIVGPKDLPKMLRTFGKTVTKLRGMAGDFQKQFNDALKEAELDGVKKSLDDIRGLNPMNEIKKQLNPFEQAAADVRSGLDKALKPSTGVETAAPDVHAAEPLKAGATAMPGVAVPEAIVAPPSEPASATAVPVAGVVAAAGKVETSPIAKVEAESRAAAKAGDGKAAAKPATAKPKAAAAKPSHAANASKQAAGGSLASRSPAKAAVKKTATAQPAPASSALAPAPAAPVKAKSDAPAASKPGAASKPKPGTANGVNRSGPVK